MTYRINNKISRQFYPNSYKEAVLLQVLQVTQTSDS